MSTLTTTNAQLQEQLTTAQNSGSKKRYTPKWLHEGSVCDPNNGLWAENGAYVYDTTEGAGLQVMLECNKFNGKYIYGTDSMQTLISMKRAIKY